jgi:hypothetical protein
MKNFKFEPLELPRIMESLHRVVGVGIPYVEIYSLKHIIVPKAVRYLPTFEGLISKKQTFSDSSSGLLTIDDFKTFEVVRARNTRLSVATTEKGEILGLKIDNYQYGTDNDLGRWGIFMKTVLVSAYDTIANRLPVPISELMKIDFEDLYMPSLRISAFSTAILSFLYFTHNFDAKKINHKYMVKVFAMRGTNSYAVDKLIEIKEKLMELGEDFLTMLDNLQFVSYLV